MTEERFVAIEEYKDGILSYIIKDKLNFVPTIRFLNAQDMYWMHERLKSNQIVINNAEVTKENEQLKQINQELNDELQETMGYLALKSGVEKENEQLKQRLKEYQQELYCKDRVLEDKGIDIECCDKYNEKMEKNNEERSCGFCKYFQLDGMFGIWCDIHDADWCIYDGDCPDFERDR